MAKHGRPPASAAPVGAASVCAFAIIASQVAGKATRDALFLSNFDISALPLALMGSAVLSIGAIFATARAMTLYGPALVVPRFFLLSAVLLVGEWILAMRDAQLATVLVYLHMAVFGSILISGFWSVINEWFDPRTAKRSIGRIVGGSTLGGLFGGFLADQVGSHAGVLAILPMIGAFHLVCAILISWYMRDGSASEGRKLRDFFARGAQRAEAESGFSVLRRVGYLRSLALVVLLGNAAATLIDYLFKARAADTFTTSAELVRFFAVFYTVAAVVTLVVQSAMTRRLLERIGIANLVAVRPAVMTVGGIVTLPVMGLVGFGILRGVEAVLQSSLFRSGYELLFTPVVPKDKRSTKTLIDVGADRMGDMLGGAVTRAVISLPVAAVAYVLVGLAILLSMAGFFIARALRRGYIRALEASLINRANVLDIKEDEVATMNTSMMDSFTGIDLTMSSGGVQLGELRAALRAAVSPPAKPTSAQESPPEPDLMETSPMERAADPEIAALMSLRSGDATRVHAELQRARLTSPVIAAQAISLLAWDNVTGWASRALAKAAPNITGQLVDRLLDPNEDFAIRRRIPRILATCTTPRAYQGLLAALGDKRFEVRFQSGRALARIHEQAPTLFSDKDAVYAAVLREAHVEKALWDDQRLIDDPAAGELLPIDEALRARSNRSLDHVFTLLSLVLPRSPLQISYKGLLTTDAVLRGTSLEYLESVLPKDIWLALSPHLDDSRPRVASTRPREEVLEELLKSNQSIELNLNELRKQAEGE